MAIIAEKKTCIRVIKIERNAQLPYSAEQLFDLVNDIERYPEFIPGCENVNIISRDSAEARASVCFAIAGVRRELTTFNRYTRPECMYMTQEDGPFDSFAGSWLFEPTTAGCMVRMSAHMQLRSWLLTATARRLAPKMADQLVAVMCRRADELYDPGKG